MQMVRILLLFVTSVITGYLVYNYFMAAKALQEEDPDSVKDALVTAFLVILNWIIAVAFYAGI